MPSPLISQAQLQNFGQDIINNAPIEDRTIQEHDDEMEQHDSLVLEAAEIYRSDPRRANSVFHDYFMSAKAGVKETAKGAIAQSTRKNYTTQIARFKAFAKRCLAPELQDLSIIRADTPMIICAWIRHSCQTSGNRTGSPADVVTAANTKGANGFSSASQMRAAASYFYITEMGCEASPFTMNIDGSWGGNPVNSTAVRQYMRGLKREKVRSGEVAESVRAITEAKLEALYRHNAQFPRTPGIERRPVLSDGTIAWAGWRQRVMMNLMYAIGFLCLLRLDEILNIQIRNLRCCDPRKGEIEILLDWRKTNQFGEVKPFFVFFKRDKPWLDVPTLLFEWLHISGITSGYLFCPFWNSDQPKAVTDTTKKLSYTVFLEDFRRNLFDINEDFELYGGHSFRRGGAQWFITVARWSVMKLCRYGGWSTEFDNFTIIRYIMGVLDEDGRSPETYLDPEYDTGHPRCSECHRNCDCV